ncbi:MAG: hypothetical protein ACI4EV_10005 [Lachnospiraceae bacterium]
MGNTDNEQISIEAIMTQIRKDSRKKRFEEDVKFTDITIDTGNLTANEFDVYKFDDDVYALNGVWKIESDRELTGNPVKRFLKRIFRRLYLFFIEKIVDDQNAFNAQTVRLMNELNCYVAQTKDENEALKNQVIELNEKLEELRRAQGGTYENSNN